MDWEYDGVGNKTKETRADNAFRSWDYDVPNRITHAIDWRMITAEPAITTSRPARSALSSAASRPVWTEISRRKAELTASEVFTDPRNSRNSSTSDMREGADSLLSLKRFKDPGHERLLIPF